MKTRTIKQLMRSINGKAKVARVISELLAAQISTLTPSERQIL